MCELLFKCLIEYLSEEELESILNTIAEQAKKRILDQILETQSIDKLIDLKNDYHKIGFLTYAVWEMKKKIK